MEEKQYEVLVVLVPDAPTNKVAMVVPTEDALLTGEAVLGARRTELVAVGTVTPPTLGHLR